MSSRICPWKRLLFMASFSRSSFVLRPSTPPEQETHWGTRTGKRTRGWTTACVSQGVQCTPKAGLWQAFDALDTPGVLDRQSSLGRGRFVLAQVLDIRVSSVSISGITIGPESGKKLSNVKASSAWWRS